MDAQWLSPEQVDAYEREHGYAPPGYRGTGSVHWFLKRHEERGLCCCGVETDRWIVIRFRTGPTLSHTPDHPVQGPALGLVGEFVPQCETCLEAEVVASYQRTLGQPGISEKTKAECVTYLATINPSRAA